MIPTTTPVSAAVAERSRKYFSTAFQSISQVGQNTVAEHIGLSAPTVSRFVNEDLERACQVFAAAGLKVVPVTMQCYQPEYINAIFTLAKMSMDKVDSIEQLSFD